MSEDVSDDAAAQHIIDIYRRHGVAYDSGRGRDLMERAYLERSVAHLGERSGTVLDLGCGGGEPIATYFIEAGHRVTGVDTSAPMLDLCRTRFPDHDWIEADMRGLALGRRFDAIIAWDSFFHLTSADQRGMFPVFAVHAAPGASLVFTSGPKDGIAMGEMFGDPLYHASLSQDEYRDLLAVNGFETADCTVEDPDCGGHTVWVARFG